MGVCQVGGSSKTSTSSSPKPVNVIFYGKRCFAGVIKLTISRWEVILGDLRGPTCNHKCLYKRQTKGDLTLAEEKESRPQSRDWRDVLWRWSWGTPRSWKKQGNGVFPWSHQKKAAQSIPWLEPSETDLRLLAYRSQRINLFWATVWKFVIAAKGNSYSGGGVWRYRVTQAEDPAWQRLGTTHLIMVAPEDRVDVRKWREWCGSSDCRGTGGQDPMRHVFELRFLLRALGIIKSILSRKETLLNGDWGRHLWLVMWSPTWEGDQGLRPEAERLQATFNSGSVALAAPIGFQKSPPKF